MGTVVLVYQPIKIVGNSMAPLTGSGPKVVQPLASDHPSGPSEIFADGFGGPVKLRDKTGDRPSGLAVGADARFIYPTMYVDARLTRHDVLLSIALRSRDRRTLHATECAMRSGVFGTRTCGITGSAPKGLYKYWMGHAGRDMSDLYDKVKENVEFRRKCAERCGFGPAVVPHVPKIVKAA